MPPIKQWPASAGFTFSTWLRIERLPSSTAQPPYTPTLFSFKTVTNHGYTAFLRDGDLVLQTTDALGAVFTHTCTINIGLFQWYVRLSL